MAEEQQDEDRIRKAYSKRIRAMQIEQQKKEIVKRYMTPDAYERLMNVRISNPQLYSQLLDLIISMAQSNKLGSKINETQLKDLLARLTFRPEPKIEIKHK
ncbi:MAG: DNA-binding protein [Candidatus Marsarchaeota archaeon]|jgi:programmed cell death protein 5|nr:DNA-binding protein [Candidatus Marsarchaeota archaeon]